MRKTIDAVTLVEGIREQLARKYANNKKQFWEDLRKLRSRTKSGTNSRRKRGGKS